VGARKWETFFSKTPPKIENEKTQARNPKRRTKWMRTRKWETFFSKTPPKKEKEKHRQEIKNAEQQEKKQKNNKTIKQKKSKTPEKIDKHKKIKTYILEKNPFIKIKTFEIKK